MSCEVNITCLVPSTRFLVSQSQDTWSQAGEMKNTVIQYCTVIVVALNPGYSFWILSEKKIFSPKLRDKIRNGKPGFEAIIAEALKLYTYENNTRVSTFGEAQSYEFFKVTNEVYT